MPIFFLIFLSDGLRTLVGKWSDEWGNRRRRKKFFGKNALTTEIKTQTFHWRIVLQNMKSKFVTFFRLKVEIFLKTEAKKKQTALKKTNRIKQIDFSSFEEIVSQ